MTFSRVSSKIDFNKACAPFPTHSRLIGTLLVDNRHSLQTVWIDLLATVGGRYMRTMSASVDEALVTRSLHASEVLTFKLGTCCITMIKHFLILNIISEAIAVYACSLVCKIFLHIAIKQVNDRTLGSLTVR